MQARAFRIRVGSGGGYFVNITSGTVSRLDVHQGETEVYLESGESAALYLADLDMSVGSAFAPKHELVLDGAFNFRREQQFVLGDMQPELHEISEQPVSIALGNWSVVTGKAFSGSCRYETEFALPEGAEGHAQLDLGEVKYTCEVTLNGHPLGVKVMPPYRYDLPAGLMKEQNQLSIRVSNTAGNEYLHTRTFDKWAPWQLSTYHQKQLEFCKDTLDSGLYGPVRLLY